MPAPAPDLTFAVRVGVGGAEPHPALPEGRQQPVPGAQRPESLRAARRERGGPGPASPLSPGRPEGRGGRASGLTALSVRPRMTTGREKANLRERSAEPGAAVPSAPPRPTGPPLPLHEARVAQRRVRPLHRAAPLLRQRPGRPAGTRVSAARPPLPSRRRPCRSPAAGPGRAKRARGAHEQHQQQQPLHRAGTSSPIAAR